MNRRKILIGGAIIVVFLALGMLSFKKSLTPYVSFSEARTAGRTVQVKGYPDHVNARFDPRRKAFVFPMTNEAGEILNVAYRGAKPGNFDQAVSVVAIGRYRGDALESDQLLVKCPSKYESLDPAVKSHPADIPVPGAPRPPRATGAGPPGAGGVPPTGGRADSTTRGR
jgi:cytochrome c-type biogenesis protein CcmE